MSKRTKIILITLVALVALCFAPIIPQTIHGACIIPPCGGPMTHFTSAGELILVKIDSFKQKISWQNKLAESEKYLGEYSGQSDPGIHLILTKEIATYNAPNFTWTSDILKPNEGRWNYFYDTDDKGRKSNPVISINFFNPKKGNYIVYFKVIDPYKKLTVTISELPDLIPVGTVLIRK